MDVLKNLQFDTHSLSIHFVTSPSIHYLSLSTLVVNFIQISEQQLPLHINEYFETCNLIYTVHFVISPSLKYLCLSILIVNTQTFIQISEQQPLLHKN